MNRKFAIIVEYVWLALALFAVGAGTHQTMKAGFEKSYMFFIIAAIAATLYSLRRLMRKYNEKNQNKEQ